MKKLFKVMLLTSLLLSFGNIGVARPLGDPGETIPPVIWKTY